MDDIMGDILSRPSTPKLRVVPDISVAAPVRPAKPARPVDTPFRAHSITTDGQAGVRPRGATVQTPDEVALQTLRAVERGRAVVETTPFVRLASTAARLAPGMMRWISAAMAAKSS